MKMRELFESDDEDMIAAIKRDCKPFLKECRDNMVLNLMMRGMKGKGDEIFKQSVRQDRKPLSMPGDKHKAFDDWSLEKFGFRARSQSVFVTGSYDDARSYGHPYAIFPIGDFEFIWSPEVGDLFMYHTTSNVDFDDLGYKDTDLKAALELENEIMVHCKEYYAVPITEDHTRLWIIKTFFRSE